MTNSRFLLTREITYWILIVSERTALGISQQSSINRKGQALLNNKQYFWAFEIYKILIATIFFSVCLSCSSKVVKRELIKTEEAETLNNKKSTFIKAHMLDGRVYVLSRWNVNSVENRVEGSGDLLDYNREVIFANREVSIPLDSVAIFETNAVSVAPAIAALTLVTAASIGVTIYCIANPKSCFGSCPTFYFAGTESERPQAEGFSSSVAPSLEARDIDALFEARPKSRELSIIMKNEALETHVVRYVNLLAAPRGDGGRVFVTSAGEFWEARDIISPTRSISASRDCSAQLSHFDGDEYYNRSDSFDLAAREFIDIEFDSPRQDSLGLIVASRQTLISTFLLYQTLAYMGNSAGEWIAALERSDEKINGELDGIRGALGKIEVLIENESGEWVYAGATGETGPLASDIRIVELPPIESDIKKIRLRLTRGYWRLDYVALATLEKQVTPLRLTPYQVYHDGVSDSETLSSLKDSLRVLTTFPGDQYEIAYQLPEYFNRYELFLEAKGYYLEWMRDEWIKEENPALALQMIVNPGQALKTLAPEYKRLEAEMEETFWNSKYER